VPQPGALDISPADLERVKARARDGLKLRGYRFEGDTICRASRFQTLRTALGAAFAGTELPDSAANPAGMKAQGKAPHSVFTGDLIDAPDQPTRRAVDEVITFFVKPCWKSIPLRDQRALTPCGPAHAEMEVAS
jgi:hypothetical protein